MSLNRLDGTMIGSAPGLPYTENSPTHYIVTDDNAGGGNYLLTAGVNTPVPTAYYDGMVVDVVINTATSNPPTLNIDGLGAKGLVSAINVVASALTANAQVRRHVFDADLDAFVQVHTAGYYRREFTTNDTYTPNKFIQAIKITATGGGGGGGGADGQGSGTAACGGGGASGATVIAYIQRADMEDSYTITRGAGGTGGAAAGGSGGNGGATTVTSTNITINAPGGGSGAGMTGISTGYANANGGTTNNGSVSGIPASDYMLYGGNDGTNGLALNGEPAQLGSGGNSYWGGGARGSSDSSGNSAKGVGSGGGAGGSSNETTNRAGGAGSNGVVIIEEYYGW